jgi:hypothetical protein
MRQRAKVDANQPEIVRALRQVGATILHLHQLGHGAPDLLVGFRGRNVLMEIKDPTQKLSAQKLSEDEVEFHSSWRGNVFVVHTAKEAVQLIGA